MIKSIGIFALLLTGVLTTSCSKSPHVCDAYTYKIRKQKIEQIQLASVETNDLNN